MFVRKIKTNKQLFSWFNEHHYLKQHYSSKPETMKMTLTNIARFFGKVDQFINRSLSINIPNG